MKNQLLIILFIGTCIISCNSIAKGQSVTKNNAAPVPDRIMLTIPGDPATSRAVTWRTCPMVEKSVGQITVATASPFFEDQLKIIEGTSTFWMEGDSTALGHNVIFKDLTPEAMYTYRVGDGENWSEWFQFTTSSKENKPFNFLYLGDFQNDIKQYCSRVIRQAYSHFPNAEFILYAGDIVSRSTEDYWNEFFYAGNWIFGTMPSVPTPGNHEYDKHEEGQPRTFSKHWNQIFVNPDNHPENLKGRTYYIDYQGVRFVSIDSPAMGNNEEDGKNTIQWLHKVLSDNPNQWTILFTHYPVYSCSQGRNSEEYRNALKPILEKYGVDLVLQGHDHTYCRGQNLEGLGEGCKNPPMYMVSVSGPKMYGLNVNKWSDRVASETQLYQNIEVNNNTINVEVFTVTGDLYDSFSLLKKKNGVNQVIESEDIRSIKENNAIPESARHRYTGEELELYKKKF
ncbi:metallophosphoesterase family protein [Draconibacterium sp.]|nr:metallophosphoesterase family protein [Draconibacterium sp.]